MGRKSTVTEEQKKIILDLKWNKHKTIKEIAEELGLSYSKIFYIIKIDNIKYEQEVQHKADAEDNLQQ